MGVLSKIRSEWKDHKYIDKVKSDTGKIRYIYKNAENKAASKLNTLKDKTKSPASVKSVAKAVEAKVSNIANKAERIGATNSATAKLTNNSSSDKLITTGKIKTLKVVEKIKSHYEPLTYSTATTGGKIVSALLGGAVGFMLYNKLSTTTTYVEVDDPPPNAKWEPAEPKKSDKETKKSTEKSKTVPKRDNSTSRLVDIYADYDEFPYQPDVNNASDLKEKDYDCTRDQDMALVNPFYELDDGSQYYEFTNNCASCSLAYELRQRGYDVEAGAMVTNGPGPKEVKELYGISDIEWLNNTTDSIYYSNSHDKKVKEIKNEILDKYGDGARGQLAVYWCVGGGHSVVWESVNGDVIVRDCQSNETQSFEEFMQYVETCTYYRTDNIDINDIKLNTDEFYIINRED